MDILKKIWQKLKNIFAKEEKIVMLYEGKDYSNQQREIFKATLKEKFEKVFQSRKKVETHICYGDGLGIKKKLES